jgi:ATP-dependent protease ClpP protease subunit
MTRQKDHANRYWGSAPVPKTKTEFFNAVTTPAPAGNGSIATIRLYGPIDSWGGFWGISTKDVGSVLDALPDSVSQIILRINSPGGEVFEAISILNMLRAHKASVTAVVDGLAASAASFITAGCDEAVMSPGTQMMIHSPWGIEVGNARDMRKHADVLDGLETSMVELYTAKAGEQDWTALLADDTYMTAAETVELGLADRIAVIPDAGETETVGVEDEQILVIPDDDTDDDAAARVVRITARAFAAAPILPSSPEPGHPNRKEDVVSYDALKAGIRERLGMTDANATDDQLIAGIDEALAETAEPTTTTTAPEGTTLVENSVLAEMQANAAAGLAARNQQIADRREQKVQAAISEGKIAPARADHWRAALVPTAELGQSGGIAASNDEDRAYSSIYPSKEA